MVEDQIHKKHKGDCKRAYICVFHVYPKFFIKFLQILHEHLLGVHCLILCLKIHRLSEVFESFFKFPTELFGLY